MTFQYLLKNILRRGVHWTNGSPISSPQLHTGLWLITWHVARIPHAPRQGLMHFWLLQASVRVQSALIVHSGLHAGGTPRNPATHEHTGCPLFSRQTLLGPQGEGEQGFPFGVSTFRHMVIILYFFFLKISRSRMSITIIADSIYKV